MKFVRGLSTLFILFSSLAMGSARDVEFRHGGDEKVGPEASILYKEGDNIVYATCGAAASCDKARGVRRRQMTFAAYWAEIVPIFQIDPGLLNNPDAVAILDRNLLEASKRMEETKVGGAKPNAHLFELAEAAFDRSTRMKIQIDRKNQFLKRFDSGNVVTVESYDAMWSVMLRPLNRLPDLVNTKGRRDLVTRREWFFGGDDLNFEAAGQACAAFGARLPRTDELLQAQYWLEGSALLANVTPRINLADKMRGHYVWVNLVRVTYPNVPSSNTVIPYYGVDFIYAAVERPTEERRSFVLKYFDMPANLDSYGVQKRIQKEAAELAPRTPGLGTICISSL